jgi:hypothetical protein
MQRDHATWSCNSRDHATWSCNVIMQLWSSDHATHVILCTLSCNSDHATHVIMHVIMQRDHATMIMQLWSCNVWVAVRILWVGYNIADHQKGRLVRALKENDKKHVNLQRVQGHNGQVVLVVSWARASCMHNHCSVVIYMSGCNDHQKRRLVRTLRI